MDTIKFQNEQNSIASIRREYSQKQLDERLINTDPILQFGEWFEEAVSSGINDPNAMILATSTSEGKPSARVVLLKGFGNQGFSFFTNYQSRKAIQIDQNSYGAIVFFWPELERQVRIEGQISKLNEEESDEYFRTRPVGSQIGAWTSPQSQVIPNREYLEKRKQELQNEFEAKEIPRPQNWGGYILSPNLIEFWQGRPDRLHDRIQYSLAGSTWKIERLAP